jgi:hypothetical protein
LKLFEESIAAICVTKDNVKGSTKSFDESDILDSVMKLLEKMKNWFAPEHANLEGDRVKHYSSLAKTFKRIK